MLYYLFQWLDKLNLPGAQVFQYISFRAACAFILSLIVSMIFGKWMIRKLKQRQIGESIRDLGLEGQKEKAGTPTMGGLIIIAAILIPVLLFNRLDNVYVLLMIFTTIWLGTLGFMDDYIKVFKKNKEGLHPKAKLLGQIILGLVVGVVMYFHPSVVIKEEANLPAPKVGSSELLKMSAENASIGNDTLPASNVLAQTAMTSKEAPSVHSTKTTIPFVKNHEFDYKWLSPFKGKWGWYCKWGIYVLMIVIVITACSNGTNLTDGMDGLAAGTSAIVGVVLGILAWLGGNLVDSNYLNIMYIPGSGEIAVFMSAFVGALMGFLWYNSYPAQVFMGDTGSLTIGGIIGVGAVLMRKELLLPILCGIFLVESLSVIMQRGYFKYTKKKYGEGRRIFKMTPLHHHYQKEGIPAIIQKPVRAIPEAKIVARFWLIGIILAVATLALLKIR